MSWEEGRLSYLAGAQFEGRELLRQVEAGTCRAYTRDEVLEGLRDLAAEEKRLRARRPAPALPPVPRQPGASRHYRTNSPRERGTKGNLVKAILGGAVVFADVVAGTASPKILAGLHKPHPHLTGPILLYAILALLTLWVVLSVAKTMTGGGQGTAPPASRTRYTFGGPR